MAFSSKADRIGMTGTLIVNNPLDMYCPMLFTGLINYNKWTFDNKFVIKDDWGSPVGYKNMEELHQILYKSTLRRTKDLLDLPEKIYKKEWLEFSKEEQDIFNVITEESSKVSLLDKIDMPYETIAKITRMRQCAVTPELVSTKVKYSTKFERLRDILNEAKLNNQKVLVFCFYAEALEIAMNYLSEFRPKLIRGGMSNSIQDIISEHENTEGFSVVFAQEKTLGAGFTLTNTEIVVFLSLPWNKSSKDQCEDRVHRIGQKKTVTVIDLLILDTFDEVSDLLVESKGAMGKRLLDGEVDEKVKKALDKLGLRLLDGDIPKLQNLF